MSDTVEKTLSRNDNRIHVQILNVDKWFISARTAADAWQRGTAVNQRPSGDGGNGVSFYRCQFYLRGRLADG